MEVVGSATVVKVVDDGGHQRGEDLQVGHPFLEEIDIETKVARLIFH